MLLAVITGLHTVANAQITITASDMPQQGEVYSFVNGDSTWASTLDLSAGANKTWDFSNPVADPSTGNIERWTAPSNSAFFVDFPTATLAEGETLSDSSNITFYSLSDTALKILGNGSTDGNLTFTPPSLVLPFPLTYNSDFSDFSTIETITDSGIPVSLEATTVATVDGWGTAITPLGTLPVLRVRREVQYLVNVFGVPVTTNETLIEFWSKDYGRLVFEHNTSETNVLGEITRTTTTRWIGGVTVSAPVLAEEIFSLRVSPNPATDNINIEVALKSPQHLKACIFSASGQLMSVASANGHSGVQQIAVDVTALPDGHYTVVLLNTHGKVFGSQQLIKQ